MVGIKSESHVVSRTWCVAGRKQSHVAPSLLLKASSSLLDAHGSQRTALRSPLTARSHPPTIDDETLAGNGGAVLGGEK